jgi:hypothetical protein
MRSNTDVTLTVTIDGRTRTFTAASASDTSGCEVVKAIIRALGDEAVRWIDGPRDEVPQQRTHWSAPVRRNAAVLRRAYPKGLPRDPRTGRVVVRRVREGMRWSNDKASPAVRAYLAGADLDDEETDREPMAVNA